jgi:hypothetical protein
LPVDQLIAWQFGSVNPNLVIQQWSQCIGLHNFLI